MRNKKIICLLAAGLGALLLTGCGGENQKTYEQANADLEEANYDYALNEYQACISAGYKLAQSYRGSGIVKLRKRASLTERIFWNTVLQQNSRQNCMIRRWQTVRRWLRIIR